MENKEIEEFVELLYPFIIKKILTDSSFKNLVRIKNATVVSVSGEKVNVKFPYDTNSFAVLNKTGKTLTAGDIICLMYWIDLKNAVAIFKIE